MNELSSSSNVFDKFRNMAIIDDDFCIKITGWTKAEFIRFSKYITSVYNTNGRTRDQLIAIYRYWMRKGTDQTSIV
jgi:hypothetical protein